MRKQTVLKLLTVLLILSMTVMTACSGGSSQTSADDDTAQNDKIVIGACMQGNQSGFIRYITSGMYEYQAASAPDIDLQVVFADDDPAKQQGQVENFVTQGVDAIILNPVDKVQSAAAVDFAADAGIPVITVNTTSDSKNVTAHVGSDDVEAGKLQMEQLLSSVPANPKVSYVNAVLGHSAQVGREQGYLEVLKQHPEATLVVQNTADWSGDKALQLVENWIQTYPNGIDIIACEADCQLVGVITAVEDAGLAGKIQLGGMDCDMPVMEKIKAGVVNCSIWQDGLGQGENSLRLAIDAAQGKEISDFMIPFEVCTKDNVDSYIEKAKARDEISNKYF
jgi:ABC-type sugar transport system substrate-binding protein